MCTLAILYRVARRTPILLAANREERFDRPTQYPKIQPGSPRVVCGIDRQAGGTWLGVNQYGLFFTMTNRPKRVCAAGAAVARTAVPRIARSPPRPRRRPARGQGVGLRGGYAGANYLCADDQYAAVVHGGDRMEVVELTPGLHVISQRRRGRPTATSGTQFLRRMLDAAHARFGGDVPGRGQPGLLAEAGRRRASRRGAHRRRVRHGLVRRCSRLPRKIQQAIYQYAPGPPCDSPYDDLSALLRQVLSTERSRKCRDANGHNGKAPEVQARAKVRVAQPVKKRSDRHVETPAWAFG